MTYRQVYKATGFYKLQRSSNASYSQARHLQKQDQIALRVASYPRIAVFANNGYTLVVIKNFLAIARYVSLLSMEITLASLSIPSTIQLSDKPVPVPSSKNFLRVLKQQACNKQPAWRSEGIEINCSDAVLSLHSYRAGIFVNHSW